VFDQARVIRAGGNPPPASSRVAGRVASKVGLKKVSLHDIETLKQTLANAVAVVIAEETGEALATAFDIVRRRWGASKRTSAAGARCPAEEVGRGQLVARGEGVQC